MDGGIEEKTTEVDERRMTEFGKGGRRESYSGIKETCSRFWESESKRRLMGKHECQYFVFAAHLQNDHLLEP